MLPITDLIISCPFDPMCSSPSPDRSRITKFRVKGIYDTTVQYDYHRVDISPSVCVSTPYGGRVAKSESFKSPSKKEEKNI